MNKDAAFFREKALKTNKKIRWEIRSCIICNCAIGFEINGNKVFFNPNCGCSRDFPLERRTFEDIALQFNNPESNVQKVKYELFWE